MTKNITVFSGTSDSVYIIKKLAEDGFRVIGSVATEEGRNMLSSVSGIEISEERLDFPKMCDFLKRTGTNIVVDASHPYAENVSKTAIEACKSLGIKYIRYERPSQHCGENCIFVENYEEAVDYVNKIDGNILITTGVNNIEKYKEVSDYKNRIYARVLDNENSFNKAKNIGLSDDHILRGSGIYTLEDNIDVIKRYNIKALVTKDSGKAGGFMEKIKSTEVLNIPAIIIKRPTIDYGTMTEDIDKVIDLVRRCDVG